MRRQRLATPLEGFSGALPCDQQGDEAAKRAEQAAHGAPLHAIREGTLSADRRYVFTLGEWVVTDDFAAPKVAAAVQVAQALQAYLEARALSRPEASKRRTHTLVLDQQYRALHGGYDRARFSRLISRYSLFAVLLAHLDEQGAVQLKKEAPARLPITAHDLAGIAEQLSDLLALTEDTLMDYAGCSEHEAAVHLAAHYAFNGELWIEPGAYYVGHAFEKAEQAHRQAEQASGHRRVALLHQADLFISKVKRVSLSDLRLSPRDAIIPDVVLEHWVNDYLASRQDGKPLFAVRRENGAVRFRLRGGAGENGLRARNQVNANKARALEAYLNHKTEVTQVRNAKELSREQYKAERALAVSEAASTEEQFMSHFGAWLMQSEFVQIIEEAYTHARGAVLRPEGSTRPLNLPDWKGKAPHPFQAMDVRAMAAVDGMINNYDVGLGKTLTCLLLIAYLKACRKISRPIISVPAGLVSNWATNAAEALPGWRVVTVGMSVARDKAGNILYKTKRDGSPMLDASGKRIERWVQDSPETKRQKIALLSAGNVDLIIMSRESYTSIPMLRETRDRLIRTDPQYQRNLETQDRMETGRPARGKHAELVKQLGVYGAMIARTKIAAPGELSFELLGCDFVAADEAHGLKNLFASPTTFGETPRFLGGGGESQRALDALHKGRFIRERGGYTYGFTASWVKNSPMEAYSMMSQVTDALSGYGLPTQEALMEQYLRIEPQIVTGMDGSVDVKPCVVGFRRLKELKSIIFAHVISRTYGDPQVVMRDGSPLQVPSAVVEEVMIDMSDEQQDLYKVLRERARNADARAKGPNHPFSILWEMRKLTVDPMLKSVGGRNPRFEKIAALALENRAQRGKGIVFLSIGEREGSFDRLKAVLVAAGYPAQEIAIVSSHTHKSSVERQDLEDDFNFGDLTLILGTDVLGQGFNLQYGTTLTINADMPWNYEEIRQRVGRAARQGNTASKVRNVYLLMRGSFDSITYTIMSGKKSWLAQLWQDVDELSNTGADFNGEEMALLMSDDPERTRKEILERKQELAELTGRAGLKRKLDVLSRLFMARQHVHSIRERACAREKGWTANDHALLSKSKEVYERMVQEVKMLGEWDFARLIHYQGTIHWVGVLPLHRGMRLKHDGEWGSITDIKDQVVSLLFDDGSGAALSLWDVTKGNDFQVSQDATQFVEAAAFSVPTLSMGVSVAVHVLDARRVNPLPKDPQAVVTVSVQNGDVRLHPEPDKYLVRSLLVTGSVVMHFMVKSDGEHLSVIQVAVLSDDAATVEASTKAQQSEKFRARLLDIAAVALGAQAIRDRAHAA
ncbi:helicase-related protein [Deinococcus psychrotolerans]|uniref:helicase-related protein n=1 Tax=Deinococcus psychrotolerans TaxID=2489213 RepID=UPI0013DE2FC6|nr:helicase-related protein [Deinococcus psychrotolerans]